jgi:hypothetical protein
MFSLPYATSSLSTVAWWTLKLLAIAFLSALAEDERQRIPIKVLDKPHLDLTTPLGRGFNGTSAVAGLEASARFGMLWIGQLGLAAELRAMGLGVGRGNAGRAAGRLAC